MARFAKRADEKSLDKSRHFLFLFSNKRIETRKRVWEFFLSRVNSHGAATMNRRWAGIGSGRRRPEKSATGLRTIAPDFPASRLWTAGQIRSSRTPTDFLQPSPGFSSENDRGPAPL